MIVSIKEFQQYTNVFQEEDNLQQSYIESAQNIINDYLGYDIEEKIYLNCELIDIETIPEIIRLTALRIASILQMESDGNIAITGKSFGDSGSRTFINTTDYYKYLLPISKFRMIRI